MGDNSGIEWTDATWNPIVGCSLVSPGCTNCYAMKMAARIDKMARSNHAKLHQELGVDAPPFTHHYAGLTQASKAGAVWTGQVALAPEHILAQPLHWKRPRRIFVNSMGDLFHESVPDEWIDQAFAVMALSPHHTFQVLTKRSKRMREYIMRQDERGRWPAMDRAAIIAVAGRFNTPALDLRNGWPLPNVWLGVSAEDQARADERIPDLLATPAAVRFVSAEPLLGPVDFRSICPSDTQWNALTGIGYACGSSDDCRFSHARLDWIIVGGESGPGARPMHPEWARAIRDQCLTAGVPFFFKQWGEWAPGENADFAPTRSERTATWWNDAWRFSTLTPKQSEELHRDDEPDLYRCGKRRALPLLDGQLHQAMPEARR
jgi:protein gp37